MTGMRFLITRAALAITLAVAAVFVAPSRTHGQTAPTTVTVQPHTRP